ncbi:hypothetical protein WN944_010265 [Citrus x changshan-huyou]|uniref:Uncharacterized protein n=1 Tax=Citrus x changshan-huyou TaxID=2935761 RepID=A0AAP0MRC3_9ROSI
MPKINLLGKMLKTRPRSSFFFCVIKGSAAGSENEKEEAMVLQLGFDLGQTSFSFNKFSDEAIFEKDNSREANLRVENKSVTSSIGLPI